MTAPDSQAAVEAALVVLKSMGRGLQETITMPLSTCSHPVTTSQKPDTGVITPET